MSPVEAGNGSTLGLNRKVLIWLSYADQGVGLAACRGKPTQAPSAPLHDRDGRHDRLVELLELQHVSTSSHDVGSPGHQVDRLRMAQLVELGVEVHCGVLAVHGHAPQPGTIDAALDARPRVMALLVAARRARPAAAVLVKDVEHGLREAAGAE